MFFGDQALFVRSKLFWRLGGFPEDQPVEDKAFSELLLQFTTPTMLETEVITGSRKFMQHGVWRSLWRCITLLARDAYRLPITAGHAFFDIVR